MLNKYDVIIVGAGPAGCQLARELSETNYKVLLTDQVKNLYENNFSSAGTPISFFKEFTVDESVIRAKCNKFTIIGPDFKKVWESQENKTAVMDFSSLRLWLANGAQKKGVNIKLGLSFLDYKQIENDSIEVKFDNKFTDKEELYYTKILVDASGPTRVIMDRFNNYKYGYINGVGLEYLIETDRDFDSKNLQFFLGSDYMPYGYAWIFPMEKNRYKVGVGYIPYFSIKKSGNKIDLKDYLYNVLEDYMKLTSTDYKLIDDHGGTLIFNFLRKDTYYNKSVIAIGDSVSTVHPLGGEGIRYAMRNARMASKYIKMFLSKEINSFRLYKKEAKRYLKGKYRMATLLSIIVYGLLNRKQVNWGLRIISRASFDRLLSILFYNNYSLKTAFKLIFKKKSN